MKSDGLDLANLIEAKANPDQDNADIGHYLTMLTLP